jgi:hypothetical protein
VANEEMDFENVEEVDAFLQQRIGQLMDNNHKAMQVFRRSALKVLEFKVRNDEIYADIIEALAIGAKMINDLTGDLISHEWGIAAADEEEAPEE